MTLHLVNIWLISCEINFALHKASQYFDIKAAPGKGIVALMAAEADDGAHRTQGTIVHTSNVSYLKKSLSSGEK